MSQESQTTAGQLVVRKVSKKYGTQVALNGVDLELLPNRCTVLIGPSGCGKSTLLRLMIGMGIPDQGEILFNGRAIQEKDLPTMRQKMGYVIQEGGLFPHIKARDNVTLMARTLKWPNERSSARLDELVQLMRFPKSALDRYPLELSGGQKQRVSLMRALMLDPQVLLMDEPLGALDPLIRSELQRDLRLVFRTLHKTVCMVTHDLSEAAYFGNSITLMRAGAIVQQGGFKDLSEHPASPFVTQFIQAQRSLHLGNPNPGEDECGS